MHFFRVSPSIIVPGRLKVQYWSDQAPIRTKWNQRLKRDLTVFYGSSAFVWSPFDLGQVEMPWNARKCFLCWDLVERIQSWWCHPLHFWWCVWHFPLEALWCTKRCSEPAYFNNAWNLILQRCWRQNLDAARVYESQAKLDQTHTDISVLQLMIAAAASIHFSNLYFDFNCHCFVSWKNPRSTFGPLVTWTSNCQHFSEKTSSPVVFWGQILRALEVSVVNMMTVMCVAYWKLI